MNLGLMGLERRVINDSIFISGWTIPLKQDGFWLAVNVFIIHQLENKVLKVIPAYHSYVLLTL